MSSRSTQIVGGPSREHAFVDAVTNALLVKVVNPSGGGGGGGGSVNISEVGGTPIGTEVPILSRGRVSTVNATTTPLGANATYTGTWEQVVDFATFTVTVFSNVASAANGMLFQWSSDGTNVDEAEAIAISAVHPGRAMSFNVRGRYFRIVYTNGGTAQTTFRLGVVFRPSGVGANNHPINDTLEDTTLAMMTRSVIVGQTTGGGGGYHNVKVTPSGALTTEVNDGGGSLTVDGTVAVTKAGGKETYRAATTSSVTVPVDTSLFFVIAGSATRRILPQRITVHCPTLTAIEYNTIVLKQFSTLPTGGTATTLTQTALDPLNSNGAAGLCQVYTAAPTDGTLVGTIGNQRVLLQATTPAAAGTPAAPIEWDFRNVGEGWGPILRQSTQCIGLAFGTAPATAVTLSLEIEWVEEAI